MPRKARLHVEGAFYHVMARGNHKQEVFHDAGDYKTYLRLVRKYSERYEVEVHGYVLMPNHVHFLLRIGHIPLSKFMQGIQQSYTQIHNKCYKKVGHLFQGRFKSLLVTNDAYLLELIRYIHLNPVKAGLEDDARKYRWSSQRHYFSGQGEKWVRTDFIKNVLAEYGGTVIDDYRLVPETLLSGEETNQVDELIERENAYRPGLDTLLNATATLTGIKPELLTGTGRSKKSVFARRLFVYAACRLFRYNIVQVADFLNRTDSAISKTLQWAEENSDCWSNDTLTELKQLCGSDPS